MEGLVEVKPNERAAGNFYFTGMVLPEYREGDQASPGSMIAQIVDPGDMEIQAKVEEGDRANINQGQAAEVKLDALPGKVFSGTVKSVAGLASRGRWWQAQTSSKFDLSIQLDHRDPSLRPGYTAQITISGNSLQGVLYLPPQAVFEKDGKPIVYVKTGAAFQAQPVQVKFRTETRVVVEGLKQGTEVALVNPESQGKEPGKPGGPVGPVMAGGGR